MTKIIQDMKETVRIYRERAKTLSKEKDKDMANIYGNIAEELSRWVARIEDAQA